MTIENESPFGLRSLFSGLLRLYWRRDRKKTYHWQAISGSWKSGTCPDEWRAAFSEINFYSTSDIEFKMRQCRGTEGIVSKGKIGLKWRTSGLGDINKGEPVSRSGWKAISCDPKLRRTTSAIRAQDLFARPKRTVPLANVCKGTL